MKKLFRTVLCCVCCLLLAFSTACGGNGNGNGGGGNGGGSGGGGNGGGGNHDGMLSVRGNINELGENIDNVPYLGASNGISGELMQSETLEPRYGAIACGFTKEGGGIDANNPDEGMPQPGQNWGNIVDSIDVKKIEDDVFYKAYAESRQYVSPCGELYYIGGANNVLDFDVKYVKENVFQNVKMLNRWVKISDSCMLRMRYDQVNNVLYCEELMKSDDPVTGPYFHYHCTTSSYTSDGREIVEYISTRQPNIGDYKYAKFYRYIEGKEQLYFNSSDEEMYGVVYSDLSQENPLVTAFSYSKEMFDEYLLEKITTEIYLPPTETDCGFAADISKEYINGVLEYNAFQQILINENGLRVGFINEMKSEEACGAHLGINLPYISNLEYSVNFKGGIDVARFYEDWQYQELIRNYDYIEQNVTYDFNLDGYEFTSEYEDGAPFMFGYGLLYSHTLEFMVEDENEILNYMTDNNFILEDKCLAQAERFLNRKEFLANNSIYGYTLDYDMSAEIIHDIFTRYITTFSHVSDEELQSYSISDALPVEQQTEDEQYYLIYDVRFSGSIAYNEDDETIDISNIVATMPKNLALDGGETLALVAVYTTGCESYEVARKTFTYNDVDLTMTFGEEAKAYIPEINGEGQINFYVINLNNQSSRVSTVYVPTCEDNVNTLLVSGALIKRLYVENNKLVIRQAEKYGFSPVIDGETMKNPFNFVQAGGAFIDGDYAILTVANGEAELGSFSYYFGKNITPAAIAIESGVAPEMLRYTLTVYNANGEVIYQGNV